MKKLLLTTIIASAHLVHALGKQEQVVCQLPALGAIKSIVIESGTTKQNPNGFGSIIDNPGTLTLLTANSIIEKVTPTAGVGGIINEYSFPNYFLSTNDARTPHVLKFESKQLGQIYISYVCNRPNALFCEDRSGNLTSTARVAININGKKILNFNGQSLPLCNRRLL